jgi:hypothetical protein
MPGQEQFSRMYHYPARNSGPFVDQTSVQMRFLRRRSSWTAVSFSASRFSATCDWRKSGLHGSEGQRIEARFLHLRAFGFGLSQDGDVGVGIFQVGRKSLLSASTLDDAC